MNWHLLAELLAIYFGLVALLVTFVDNFKALGKKKKIILRLVFILAGPVIIMALIFLLAHPTPGIGIADIIWVAPSDYSIPKESGSYSIGGTVEQHLIPSDWGLWAIKKGQDNYWPVEIHLDGRNWRQDMNDGPGRPEDDRVRIVLGLASKTLQRTWIDRQKTENGIPYKTIPLTISDWIAQDQVDLFREGNKGN